MNSPLNSTSHDAASPEDWTPCTPGTMQAYGQSHRAEAQGQQLRRGLILAGSTLGVVLCVALVGSALVNRGPANSDPASPTFPAAPVQNQPGLHGGIACGDVRQNLQGYLDGTLPAALHDQIKVHLTECSHCRKALERLQASQASVGTPATVAFVWTGQECGCGHHPAHRDQAPVRTVLRVTFP